MLKLNGKSISSFLFLSSLFFFFFPGGVRSSEDARYLTLLQLSEIMWKMQPLTTRDPSYLVDEKKWG